MYKYISIIIYIYIYIYIYRYRVYTLYGYKYIQRTNKTDTSKQLLVSCLNIHQAYNM